MFIGSNLLIKYCFEAEYVSYKINILIKYRIQIMYFIIWNIITIFVCNEKELTASKYKCDTIDDNSMLFYEKIIVCMINILIIWV